jgi:hypothetical protein
MLRLVIPDLSRIPAEFGPDLALHRAGDQKWVVKSRDTGDQQKRLC